MLPTANSSIGGWRGRVTKRYSAKHFGLHRWPAAFRRAPVYRESSELIAKSP
jgi:hypothetical protein